ncbi:MAG: GNAT family N-acetyltransferase [Anaerolineales bacterium]|nr:GNAT family N-acetyltransferase [Anaerolineales bacterium]
MNITIQNSLPEDIWRKFVSEHPHGNIFHTPEMFKVFGSARGHSPSLWAAVDNEKGVLALLLPVQIVLSQLLQRFTSRAVAYGSVLCDLSQDGHEALGLLLQTYQREIGAKLLFTELRNLSDLEAIQPVLQVSGFTFEEHLNYLVNLDQPLENILQGIGSRTRKNIRRGLRRQNVLIEQVRDRDRLSTCYSLLEQTYQAAHVPLAHPSLFEAAFDLLVPAGMARFTLGYVDRAPISVSIDLLYKNVIYGWYGATDRAYSSYNPTEMVTWDLFRWGAENNYRLYDFGGAGKTDEKYGVRDFKAKFGGDLVNYGRNIYVHTPTRMKISQKVYSLIRRVLY